MRTVEASLPAGDLVDSPRLVLRDGTVASVRIAEPADREAIRRFFHDLSPDSRRKRFFISSEPPATLIDLFGDNHDATQTLTLLVHRHCATDVRPIAVASYFAVDQQRAEVAFAVDDQFHGKGLATALLERLAVLAAGRGFELFEASTLDGQHRDAGSVPRFRVRNPLEDQPRRRHADAVADTIGRTACTAPKSATAWPRPPRSGRCSCRAPSR